MLLPWQAQGLYTLIARKVDRAGVLPLGRLGLRAVAVVLGKGDAWPEMQPYLQMLVDEEWVELDGDRLIMPEFIEQQEARQSDKARQRKARELARARRSGTVTGSDDDVTNRDNEGQEEDGRDADVTNRDATVTPSRTEPSRTDPDPPLVPQRGIDGADLFGEKTSPEKPKAKRRARKEDLLRKHRPNAERLWAYQEKLRKALNPGCRGLDPTDERLIRVAERLEAGNTVDDCVHVLKAYYREAKAKPEAIRYLNGETNWRAANFDRALGVPLDTPIAPSRPNGQTAAPATEYRSMEEVFGKRRQGGVS
jgi:hypothetical protein